MAFSNPGSIFIDADSFHSTQNKEKMAMGRGLTDLDRKPWLEALTLHIRQISTPVYLACSSLKKSYRDHFRINLPDVHLSFIILVCSRDILENRLNQRSGHFLKSSSLLSSQLNDLEIPNIECEPDCQIIHVE